MIDMRPTQDSDPLVRRIEVEVYVHETRWWRFWARLRLVRTFVFFDMSLNAALRFVHTLYTVGVPDCTVLVWLSTSEEREYSRETLESMFRNT